MGPIGATRVEPELRADGERFVLPIAYYYSEETPADASKTGFLHGHTYCCVFGVDTISHMSESRADGLRARA